jgi:hypothetical protein
MGITYVDGSVASHSCLFQEFVKEAEDDYAQYIEHKQIPTRTEYYNKKHKEEERNDKHKGFVSGEHKLRTFIYIVHNCYKWNLNRFQRKFISIIIQSLAPFIVGEEWAAKGPALCKEFGWTRIVMQAIATSARRVGKSVTLGVAQSTVALVMAGSKQATFSTGKRASSNLRDSVVKNLVDSGYSIFIASKGLKQERMEVHPIFGDLNNKSQLDFYPSNKQISVFIMIIIYYIHT